MELWRLLTVVCKEMTLYGDRKSMEESQVGRGTCTEKEIQAEAPEQKGNSGSYMLDENG